jgi:hypothetical protein
MTKNQIIEELELCVAALKSSEDVYTINKLNKVIDALKFEFSMSEAYYAEIISYIQEY